MSTHDTPLHLLLPFGLVMALALVTGCGAKSSDDLSDSQGHWLKHCDESAECGGAACMCGVCTSECTADADCWRLGDSSASRCANVRVDGCPVLADGASICIPDCPNDECLSVQSGALTTSDDGTESNSSTLLLSSMLEFDDYSVPRCPKVADTTSLPLVSVRPSIEAYEGTATVRSVAATTALGSLITLTPDEVPNGSIEFSMLNVPGVIAEGAQLSVLFRSGKHETNANYAFIIVKDDAGLPLVVGASGGDTLYQQGLFSTKDTWGAIVELRITCEASGDDGCLENQTRAEYQVTFRADDELVHDGKEFHLLSIDGRTYETSALSSSISGGESHCDGIEPSRYLHFAAVAR